MAIVVLNPILRSLSGRIGGFVFYRRHATQCVRIFVQPRNPRTESQQNNRAMFAEAVSAWQSLPKYKQIQWNNYGRYGKHSGYNLFISRRMHAGKEDIPVQTALPFGSPASFFQFRSVSDPLYLYDRFICTPASEYVARNPPS